MRHILLSLQCGLDRCVRFLPSSSRVALFSVCLAISIGGCNDLTGHPGLPAGTPNPSSYNTKAGAVGMRSAAVFELEYALQQYVIDAGLLSDELEDVNTGASPGVLSQLGGTVSDPLDERILPTGVTVKSYNTLQAVRTFTNQAIGALATYDTGAADLDSSRVLRGELYALEGYAEIMLADLFCSGVPLSTLDFQHDFTYAPSSTTAQVYQHAIAKFDTALTLASTSDSVVHLAQVGKGRAYIDLGQYAAAADDVTTVPSEFIYQFGVIWVTGGGTCEGTSPVLLSCRATIADREGINGLPFLSSGDPRTAADIVAQPNPSNGGPFIPLTFPVKYGAALSGSGYAPFTLASGVEARLIEAEAALQANPNDGTWLAKLNQLRQTALIPGTTQPDPQALPTLNDPVDPVARIDTLFTERAAWLFMDGHRQGDLRRLLRQYSQYAAFNAQQKVYPTGPYLAPGTGVYGTDVLAPIPTTESTNPDFHGCLDYDP